MTTPMNSATRTSLPGQAGHTDGPLEAPGSYLAALATLSPALPILMALIMVGAYYLLPSVFGWKPSDPGSAWWGWVTLGSSIVFSFVVWLVAALLYFPRTRPRNANPLSYHLVMLWYRRFLIKELPATSDAADGRSEQGSSPSIWKRMRQFARRSRVARPGDEMTKRDRDRRAHLQYDAARTSFSLELQRPGIRWPGQVGYLNLWNDVHYAEEAWIEIGPPEEVVEVAYQTAERLNGSNIPNKGNLYGDLRSAALQLSPTAEHYFRPLPSSNHTGTNQPSRRTAHGASPQADEKRMARIIIREVLATVNNYREVRFEALVTSRNLLYLTTTLSGVATAFLVLFCVIAAVQPAWVVSGTVLYLFGALVGLVARLYTEAHTDQMADEYGLSEARILTAPVLSGLAAVAGVLLYIVLLQYGGTLTADSSVPLGQVFELSRYPIDFVIAAIFGLSPNLLISYLQRQTKQYLGDLKSSEPAEGANIPSAMTLV